MNLDPRFSWRLKAMMTVAGFCVLVTGMVNGASRDSILPLNIKVGDKAPDFALPSADGRIVRISDYAGHNVLIDFYRGHW